VLLTVPRDLWRARVLIIAPAMAGLVLMVMATLEKDLAPLGSVSA